MHHHEYVPTLIIGASMLGLGIAFRKGEEAVTLEPSSGVGNEFIRSMKLSGTAYDAATPEGIELQRELVCRNVMSDDGRLHLPGLMHVLIRRIAESQLDVRLQTSVVEVGRRGDRYEVLISDASGLRMIVADQLIDTTATCLTKPGAYGPKAKSLNILVSGLQEPQDESLAPWNVVRGRFAQETVLKVPVEPQDDWIAARNKLFRFWLDRPEPLRSCTYVVQAEQFDMEYDADRRPIEPGWDWIPSAYYAHLLESFDQGYRIFAGGER